MKFIKLFAQTITFIIVLLPLFFVGIIIGSILHIANHYINKYNDYSFKKQINNHWRIK